ncbi:MAG: CYTH domain-containing protein [Gemmatimonadales bacterium]|nr:CYTH domain-containing protein [Gemmatimonadales bacterium]
MSKEIERKYLVDTKAWNPGPAIGTRYRQGYLSIDPERVVRVRTDGRAAFLTIKGRITGITRSEFEYPIPLEDAEVMLAHMRTGALIEKTRYRVEFAGRVWEVDEFEGENTGLVVAEVELPDEAASIAPPPWVRDEVSYDSRYFNTNLARHPYGEWDHGP